MNQTQKMSLNIPFEIHLTTLPIIAIQTEAFETLCSKKHGKALLIELARGENRIQPMLSLVVHKRGLNEVLNNAQQLVADFAAEGFTICRTKIEIPIEYAESFKPIGDFTTYYEWHGKVNFERQEDLTVLCLNNGAHLSRNAIRNNQTTRFVTIREYGEKDLFRQRVQRITHALTEGRWLLTKQEFEYCVFDDQVQLDSGWLADN
ncbi:MAG: hypothetical protein JWO06_2444 [Bacteroidota bacterium]|nr:hypothetical protein [Bacteroidota bacterium]